MRLEINLEPHAIARYQERVKPVLDLEACADELDRLVRICEQPVTEHPPDWLSGSDEDYQFYMELTEGVCLCLVPAQNSRKANSFYATTVLTRSSLNPYKRKSRKSRKQAKRTRRIREGRLGGRVKQSRGYDRSDG